MAVWDRKEKRVSDHLILPVDPSLTTLCNTLLRNAPSTSSHSTIFCVRVHLRRFEIKTCPRKSVHTITHGSGAVIRIHCAWIQWSRRAPKIPRRNLQTFVGHGSIRNAVQSYTEAKQTWRSEAAEARSITDMECDAVCKDGYKGKSKCGKGESKNPEGDECYICGKRGHVQKDCWYKDTRGERGKGKVKRKGKQKPVTEVSQEDSKSSNNSLIVANFTSDWIFAVTWADNSEEICESEVEILLDSGAYDHVCSPEFTTHSPLLTRLDTGVFRNADGSEIQTHRRRRVRFGLEEGQIASVEFQVMNVKRCIFSIGRLIEQGLSMYFERQVLTRPDGRQAQTHRQECLYHLRAQLLETERATQVNPVWVDEQGNEKEMKG